MLTCKKTFDTPALRGNRTASANSTESARGLRHAARATASISEHTSATGNSPPFRPAGRDSFPAQLRDLETISACADQIAFNLMKGVA